MSKTDEYSNVTWEASHVIPKSKFDQAFSELGKQLGRLDEITIEIDPLKLGIQELAKKQIGKQFRGKDFSISVKGDLDTFDAIIRPRKPMTMHKIWKLIEQMRTRFAFLTFKHGNEEVFVEILPDNYAEVRWPIGYETPPPFALEKHGINLPNLTPTFKKMCEKYLFSGGIVYDVGWGGDLSPTQILLKRILPDGKIYLLDRKKIDVETDDPHFEKITTVGVELCKSSEAREEVIISVKEKVGGKSVTTRKPYPLGNMVLLHDTINWLTTPYKRKGSDETSILLYGITRLNKPGGYIIIFDNNSEKVIEYVRKLNMGYGYEILETSPGFEATVLLKDLTTREIKKTSFECNMRYAVLQKTS